MLPKLASAAACRRGYFGRPLGGPLDRQAEFRKGAPPLPEAMQAPPPTPATRPPSLVCALTLLTPCPQGSPSRLGSLSTSDTEMNATFLYSWLIPSQR